MDDAVKQPTVPDAELDALLKFADKTQDDAKSDLLARTGAPDHRQLKIVVSSDRLDAHFEAVFSDTTREEVEDALVQARVCWGIDKEGLWAGLEKAKQIGRLQKNVPIARGKAAVYKARKEVSYPFLEGKTLPDSREGLHLASRVFRDIVDVLRASDIEQVRSYALPVVVVGDGMVLMAVRGEDVVEPGRDVYGKEIRQVAEEGIDALKPGDGVTVREDGSLVAERYGYVAIRGKMLSVLSPVWISFDHLEAYFVNPPALGEHPVPTPPIVVALLQAEGVCVGIDEKVIGKMCHDLIAGAVRESCVRIARGKIPTLAKGQFQFHFEPLPTLHFEKIRNLIQSIEIPDVSLCEDEVRAVSAGMVLAQQVGNTDTAGSGRDIFDHPVAASEASAQKRGYKAGINVRREVSEGSVTFVAEIYGYAGIRGDRIEVVSPIWTAADRMTAYFVALSQSKAWLWPSAEELGDLLEKASIRFGVDEKMSAAFAKKEHKKIAGCICVAQGEPCVPGQDGSLELMFKRLPDPGQIMDGDKIDFRARDAVPQVHTSEMLARRSFPKEGTPGRDVRGRLVNPPRVQRELLYAGSGVTMEEKDGEQVFHASTMGWARVVKDTLSVQKRFKHQGDVDFHLGNVKMEGDVEIDGSVKSRFRVEASGDVYVSGAVESRAEVIAGGNVVVQRGVIGAKVKAGGNFHARFVQESTVEVGGNLLVRNFVRESEVQVVGKAIVQGNEGGERHLCLLGGVLFAGHEIEASSLGAAYGRPTRVLTGVDVEAEQQLERYRKGLGFSDLQMRRAIRGLGGFAKGGSGVAETIRRLPVKRKQFVLSQLKELNRLKQLRASLVHYIAEFEEQRKAAAAGARVKVAGVAFSKVQLQIGSLHQLLDREISSVVFRLNEKADAIVHDGMT